MKKIPVVLILLSCCVYAQAQVRPGLKRNRNAPSDNGSPLPTTGNSSKADSLGLGFEHRDDAKDSITISFKYLDSSRSNTFDSSLNDFYKYFSVPATQQYLGNNGAAGYNIIYTPFMKAGWDAGFHAYDAYRFTLEGSRFFKTTKPFTQLNYQLASGKEQMVRVIHTQNPRPNLNVGFEYRLISAPGFFITQNTNHNNYRIFSNYSGKRKRYGAYFILMGNSLKGSENGGIQNDSFISSKNYSKRFTVPVNLGGAAPFEPNPFKSSVNTGNTYKDFTFFFRQTYDVGKKDSVEVNDSTTEYLFYPKLRFQYTFMYNTSSYQFKDVAPDSAVYKDWYDLAVLKKNDTFAVRDQWKMISNDFSLVQFPDTKNAAQFFLAGARLENIKGEFGFGSRKYYNIVLHGEYRNKTRNKLWDIFAKGELYTNGLNAGNYSANAMLARVLNKKLGSVRISFSNVNRSPSFIYEPVSSFNNSTVQYKNENITVIKASAENPFFTLSATNYFIANLLYFKNYYQTDQYSKLVNLLQLSASKKIRLGKKWNWYTEVVLQQTDGSAPVKVPLIFTRNRIALEGTFYKNLNLSTGLEFRYYTAYDGYNYSPIMGQFMPQDTFKLKNRPDVSAYMHFRIKSFTAYLRLENLNAVNFTDGFGFTHNNYAAPHYFYPGMIFRVGIQWNFVN